MSAKKIIITRKIELRFDTSDSKERKEYYSTMYRWRDICVKGANQVVSHLYYLLKENDFVYLSEKAKVQKASGYVWDDGLPYSDITDEQKREIYKTVAENEKQTLVTSNQNAFYQLLSHLYKTKIPTSILSALNSVVVQKFNKEKVAYLKGEKSLSVYKDTLPIPIQSASITKIQPIENVYNGKAYKNFCFVLHKIPFQTWFGRDLSDNKSFWKNAFSTHFLPEWIWNLEDKISDAIIQLSKRDDVLVIGNHKFIFKYINSEEDTFYYQIAVGENPVYEFRMREKRSDNLVVWRLANNYKLCDSSIAIEREKMKGGSNKEITKLFLLATFEIDRKRLLIDREKIAECYLDVEIPIRVQIEERTIDIGSVEEFLHRRLALQQGRQRLQRASKYNNGRKGRVKKTQTLNKVRDMESQYVAYKTHQYSKMLIDLALKFRVGTVILKDQVKKEMIAENDEFLLRNWSYFDLKSKIEYKARKCGIIVIVE